MSSRVEGVDELTKRLAALTDPKGMARALRSASAAGMRIAQTQAKGRVPVGSRAHRTYRGRLVTPGFAQRSLRVVTYANKEGTKAGALLGVKAEAFYALQFIELGTAARAATPWLEPSFASVKDAVLQRFKEQLKKRVDAAAKGSRL